MAITMNLINENILPKLETNHNGHKDQKVSGSSGLSAWYKNTLAIKHVSMTIKSQAITAIIGPSGCGKIDFYPVSKPHA